MHDTQRLPPRALRIHPGDNLVVALTNLAKGDQISVDGQTYTLVSNVPAKHKFATAGVNPGEKVIMYGVQVGKAVVAIRPGEVVTVSNIEHQGAEFRGKHSDYSWTPPDVSRWQGTTFQGFRRSDGQIGTRNHWIVVPLVFCENQNVQVLREAFEKELGFAPREKYRSQVADLAKLYREGRIDQIQSFQFGETPPSAAEDKKLFPNVDGIKFLTHQGGCGGTREDARSLCGLIAGYIHHPNVCGATILSLGCQNAQVAILREEIAKRNARFDKPLLVFDQQQSRLESTLLSEAIRETFLGLVKANQATRSRAPLSALTIGLKCGGSDGFSGITANPAIGHVSDLIAALGGKTILAEFPELCGVEQNLIDRSRTPSVADRFIHLMRAYAARAQAVGSGFDMNPSPGNIKDGLITDAMKSAGAAKKGGTSPVADVRDYPEYATEPGLNLLCTPGSDVEAVTAQVGAGSNIVLFTSGLGTPTGNPIAPVMKLSTNSVLANGMSDIIDFDCGAIVSGGKTLEETGEAILARVIAVASGEKTKAELLRQDDFIPWKRGVSL
jgi:altronate hydrolase